MNHKDNTATLTNGDATAKIELRDDGVIAIEFRRKGVFIRPHFVAPDLDEYDAEIEIKKI